MLRYITSLESDDRCQKIGVLEFRGADYDCLKMTGIRLRSNIR